MDKLLSEGVITNLTELEIIEDRDIIQAVRRIYVDPIDAGDIGAFISRGLPLNGSVRHKWGNYILHEWINGELTTSRRITDGYSDLSDEEIKSSLIFVNRNWE